MGYSGEAAHQDDTPHPNPFPKGEGLALRSNHSMLQPEHEGIKFYARIALVSAAYSADPWLAAASFASSAR